MSATVAEVSRLADDFRSFVDRITWRQIIAAVLIVLLIAFVVDNTNSIRVGFVFFHARAPLIWVLLVTALIGVAADRLFQHRSRRARQKAQEQQQP